jgi:hypothetical protein
MSKNEFDRNNIRFSPLSERRNKVQIVESHVLPTAEPTPLDPIGQEVVAEIAERLKTARENDKARMLTFGAHTIKNGLAPTLIWLIEEGWITHLATNGAAIIHDWEFAYQGASSEDVEENVRQGKFGIWEETGKYLNLAILLGAYQGLGYGESIGKMVEVECLDLPSIGNLRAEIAPNKPYSAAAADLLEKIIEHDIPAGTLDIPHPYKQYGLQSAAFRLGVPFTGHPMFGHDIHYTHPMNCGAAIGRTAERDFLRFAKSVSNLEGGVYLSIGSAVMSPMVFEKSLSMARNVAIQNGETIDDHYMAIVDLAKSHWDWTQGEPPEDNPDYYLRYNKTFSRMGGTMRFISADNRDFLLTLVHALKD